MVEELSRMQLLASLFPSYREDPFMLRQLKHSIEESLLESGMAASGFEDFEAVARRLASGGKDPDDRSCAFIRIDLQKRGWDPLFVHAELVQQLQRNAAAENIFIVIMHLGTALFPQARRRSIEREKQLQTARASIEELVCKWTRTSARVQLFFA